MFYANRFAIFCVPLCALGVGCLGQYVVNRNFKWGLVGVLLVMTFQTASAFRYASREVIWPVIDSNLGQAFAHLPEVVPEEGVCWTWWDHGYVIQQVAHRATLADGGVHDGELSVHLAFPLASDNPQLAANFIQFYATHGHSGTKKIRQLFDGDLAESDSFLKRVLKAGPELTGATWHLHQDRFIKFFASEEAFVDFFYPPHSPPVFLVLDRVMAETAVAWFELGTWNLSAQSGKTSIYRPFYEITGEDGVITNPEGLHVTVPNWRPEQESRVVVMPMQAGETVENESSQFEFFLPQRYGVQVGQALSQSVYHRLWLRQQSVPGYFESVYKDMPIMQVWKVTGDRRDAP